MKVKLYTLLTVDIFLLLGSVMVFLAIGIDEDRKIQLIDFVIPIIFIIIFLMIAVKLSYMITAKGTSKR